MYRPCTTVCNMAYFDNEAVTSSPAVLVLLLLCRNEPAENAMPACPCCSWLIEGCSPHVSGSMHVSGRSYVWHRYISRLLKQTVWLMAASILGWLSCMRPPLQNRHPTSKLHTCDNPVTLIHKFVSVYLDASHSALQQALVILSKTYV